jgi:hypothetical protein
VFAPDFEIVTSELGFAGKITFQVAPGRRDLFFGDLFSFGDLFLWGFIFSWGFIVLESSVVRNNEGKLLKNQNA